MRSMTEHAHSTDHHTATSVPQRVGLIAGWGQYPFRVATALRDQGCEVYGLGVRDHADPALAELCTKFGWIGVASIGRATRFFRRHQVRDATMAGKIHKIQLFQLRTWLRHCPDWTTIQTFWPHFISGKQDRKDDTLLTAICDAFANGGVRFGPATDYAPELLVKYGQLTANAPTAMQQKDIEFGWQLAREMGRLDVGQCIVVKNRAVIAVEAIEGTDECIKRAAELCGSGYTVVKVAKPQQDMRFDVPTIGIGTLENMAATGGRVLAIQEKMTIIIDEQAVVEFANRHNIAIVALHAAGQYDLAETAAPAA
jgi:DUF1009 family protein